MLKRKGVSDEKVEATADSSNEKNAEASGGSDAWFSFHCVMDLEAISSTYPQTIDFCTVLLCIALLFVVFSSLIPWRGMQRAKKRSVES